MRNGRPRLGINIGHRTLFNGGAVSRPESAAGLTVHDFVADRAARGCIIVSL
jgi:hypothetical protein